MLRILWDTDYPYYKIIRKKNDACKQLTIKFIFTVDRIKENKKKFTDLNFYLR